MTLRFICLAVATVLCLQAGPSPGQTTFEGDLKGPTFVVVRRTGNQTVKFFDKTKDTEITIRFLFKFQPVKTGKDATVYDVTIVACEDKEVVKGGTPRRASSRAS